MFPVLFPQPLHNGCPLGKLSTRFTRPLYQEIFLKPCVKLLRQYTIVNQNYNTLLINNLDMTKREGGEQLRFKLVLYERQLDDKIIPSWVGQNLSNVESHSWSARAAAIFIEHILYESMDFYLRRIHCVLIFPPDCHSQHGVLVFRHWPSKQHEAHYGPCSPYARSQTG